MQWRSFFWRTCLVFLSRVTYFVVPNQKWKETACRFQSTNQFSAPFEWMLQSALLQRFPISGRKFVQEVREVFQNVMLQFYGIQLNRFFIISDFVLIRSRNGNQKSVLCCVSNYALCRVDNEGAGSHTTLVFYNFVVDHCQYENISLKTDTECYVACELDSTWSYHI